MIEIKNIHKSFGHLEVLKGIDATVDRGEIVSVVGASGAGKTTLLQIVGTLEKPDTGQILIDGCPVFDLREKSCRPFVTGISVFVFQFHQLLPEFTALENVMLPALIARTNRAEARRQAAGLLDFLGLSDRLSHKPAQLSGEKAACCRGPGACEPTRCRVGRRTVGKSRFAGNKTEIAQSFFSICEKNSAIRLLSLPTMRHWLVFPIA